MNIQKLIYSLSVLAGLFMISTGASESSWYKPWTWEVGWEQPNKSNNEVVNIDTSKAPAKKTTQPKSEDLLKGWVNVKEENINPEVLREIEKTQNPTLGRQALEKGKEALSAIGESEIVQETKKQFTEEAKTQGSTLAKAAAGTVGILGAGAIAALAAKAKDLIDWFSNKNEQKPSAQPTDGSAKLKNEIDSAITQLNANIINQIKSHNTTLKSAFKLALQERNWSDAQEVIDALGQNIISINGLAAKLSELKIKADALLESGLSDTRLAELSASLKDTVQDKFNPTAVKELISTIESTIAQFKKELAEKQRAPQTSAPMRKTPTQPVASTLEDIEETGGEVSNPLADVE